LQIAVDHPDDWVYLTTTEANEHTTPKRERAIMLTSDQDARIRFAQRLYDTGLSHGAPESAVESANDLIKKTIEAWGQVREITSADFRRVATSILKAE